jgi:cytochrome o ubiquinol oxidase operon protein cyoD
MSTCKKMTPDANKAKKLLLSYTVGFLAALLFTLISFFLATHHATRNEEMTFLSLGVLIVLQVIVQVVFFFRLGTSTADDKLNFWVFMFTLLIMLIVVSGSLWIMYNLNYFMVN